MAKCEVCEQEMRLSNSCTANAIILGTQGDFYERDASYYDDNDRCHDCGIINRKGNFHHLGCDIERCPKCGHQLISCGCSEDQPIVPVFLHKPVEPWEVTRANLN